MVALHPDKTPPIALALKAVGCILLAIAVIDYAIVLSGTDLAEVQARFQLTSQVVDRGVLPLLGIALMGLSIWVEQLSQPGQSGLMKPVVLLSSALLALLFLLMGPMHFIDAGQASAAATREINARTTQAEAQLDNRLQQERAQINAVLSDPSQLADLETQLNSDDLPADAKERLTVIKENLTRFQADPSLLDTQQEGTRNQALNEIRGAALEESKRAALEFRKSRFRITVSSLMLAGAFLFIFWTGYTQAG